MINGNKNHFKKKSKILFPLFGISSVRALFSPKKVNINCDDYCTSTTNWIISDYDQRPLFQKEPVKFLFSRNLMVFSELKMNFEYNVSLNFSHINKHKYKYLISNIGLILPFGETIFPFPKISPAVNTRIGYKHGVFKSKSDEHYPIEHIKPSKKRNKCFFNS